MAIVEATVAYCLVLSPHWFGVDSLPTSFGRTLLAPRPDDSVFDVATEGLRRARVE